MDNRIREALETARDDFHTLAISKAGDFDELGLSYFGSICEKRMTEALSILTSEPEPCEDSKILAGRILANAKPQTWIDQIDEYAEQIESYASRVFDKRVEELRAQIEMLREIIKGFLHAENILGGVISMVKKLEEYLAKP